MKKKIRKILIIIPLLLFSCSALKAQSDIYNWSIKLGGGYAFTVPGGSTKEWWGNSNGPMLFAGVGFKNILLNATFRYFSEETKSDLTYGYYILPEGANVRMVHFELTCSYEKELAYRFFIEPYLGYLKNNISSNIIDTQGNEINIEDINGATLGLNFIKYFKFIEGGFIGLFVNVGYDIINFKKLNPNLSNNSFGYSFGISLKGVDRKHNKKNKETDYYYD